MTFPIVEILCNECGKSMMVSKPEVIDSDKEGYDKLVVYRYTCATDRKSISMRMYIPNVGLEESDYIPTYMNTKEKEGKFEDLYGNLYEPIIENGVYVCPICKGQIAPLNLLANDPDYFLIRCPKCNMDFKIENKPTKDFIFIKD